MKDVLIKFLKELPHAILGIISAIVFFLLIIFLASLIMLALLNVLPI